jgi:hypothetical protein
MFVKPYSRPPGSTAISVGRALCQHRSSRRQQLGKHCMTHNQSPMWRRSESIERRIPEARHRHAPRPRCRSARRCGATGDVNAPRHIQCARTSVTWTNTTTTKACWTKAPSRWWRGSWSGLEPPSSRTGGIEISCITRRGRQKG